MKDLLIITPSRGRPQRLQEMLYVPDVVIEHVLFRAGKTHVDQVYAAAESWTQTDKAAYLEWRELRMGRDVMRVRLKRAMRELRLAGRR